MTYCQLCDIVKLNNRRKSNVLAVNKFDDIKLFNLLMVL